MKKTITAGLTLLCSILCTAAIVFTGCSSSDNAETFTVDKSAVKTTEEQTTEAATETTTEEVKIDILMVGDMLAHEGVYNSGLRADGTYNYSHLFKNVQADVLAADVAIVNQETILGGTQLGLSGYPTFNSPQELGDGLVDAGFDVILHATNHALDRSTAGIDNTLYFWRNRHPQIAVLGIHDNQEDYDNNNFYVYEKDGIKISFLNYTYGTNGIPLPAEYMVNLLDKEKVAKDMAQARSVSDFVVVCPHWGTEYMFYASDYQKDWAQFLTDNGADLILGGHPHVVEPVDIITSTDGTRKTLCYYSVGNFTSNQDTQDSMLGAMAKVSLSNKGGKIHIDNYSVIPLVTHIRWAQGEQTTYKLSQYTDELAAQNQISSYGVHISVAGLQSICDRVFGDLYKKDSIPFDYIITDEETESTSNNEATSENETSSNTEGVESGAAASLN